MCCRVVSVNNNINLIRCIERRGDKGEDGVGEEGRDILLIFTYRLIHILAAHKTTLVSYQLKATWPQRTTVYDGAFPNHVKCNNNATRTA